MGKGNFDCLGVSPTAATFYECKGYRLPTDPEYEYADRAGTTTATYAGDVLDLPDGGSVTYPDPAIDAIGWCGGTNTRTTHVGAGKKADAFGLYDMIGNVEEWVDGNFLGGGYGTTPLTDPVGTLGQFRNLDGGPTQDTTGGITRGGSFWDFNSLCRSASRLQAFRSLSEVTIGYGFRLVRTVK